LEAAFRGVSFSQGELTKLLCLLLEGQAMCVLIGRDRGEGRGGACRLLSFSKSSLQEKLLFEAMVASPARPSMVTAVPPG
jgi:hypothetical protein